MTKTQYQLLEDFALNRLDSEFISVEALRQAANAAVLIIPFAKVQGMEHFASEPTV